MRDIEVRITKCGTRGWFLTGKMATKKYIQYDYLTSEVQVLHHFVCCNLKPTSHTSELPKEMTLLLYLLMDG